MRLSQLQYFIKVVDIGGVNATARELHVSQPTITTAIKELEAELKTPLFQRVKQRMILTEQGSYFYRKIAPALLEIYSAADDIRELSVRENQVRLGVPPMIGLFMMPYITAGFSRNRPDIDVKIIESSTDDLRNMLDEDRVDMALMIGESPYNTGLGQHTVLCSKYSFFVGKGHPLAQQAKQLTLQQMAREPLALFDKGLYLNRFITQAFRKEHLAPNIVLTSSQINTIKEFVGQGMASTFLIRQCVEAQDLLVEVPTDLDLNLTIVAAWKKGRVMSSGCTKLLKFMQKLNQP